MAPGSRNHRRPKGRPRGAVTLCHAAAAPLYAEAIAILRESLGERHARDLHVRLLVIAGPLDDTVAKLVIGGGVMHPGTKGGAQLLHLAACHG